MACILALHLALGTSMEASSMIITTVPVVFPLVTAPGYDPIWFGVVVAMLVEIAQRSPLDGTVMHVLRGMCRDGGRITEVFAGVLPCLASYLMAVMLPMASPGLALWLPRAWG